MPKCAAPKARRKPGAHMVGSESGRCRARRCGEEGRGGLSVAGERKNVNEGGGLPFKESTLRGGDRLGHKRAAPGWKRKTIRGRRKRRKRKRSV